MTSHSRFAISRLVLVLHVVGTAVSGQPTPTPPPTPETYEVIPANALPGTMRQRYEQLGERLRKAETSRVVYTGVLKDSAGERPVEIVIQNPGHVRITEQGVPPRIVSFNGTRVNSSSGAATAGQTGILETMLLDSPEALFQQLAKGEAYQKLPARFRLTNRPTPAATEEYVDLYRLFPRGAAAKAIANTGAVKMIGFDSVSGLPRFVSYARADGTAVAVDFEDWTTSGTEKYPRLIRRLERGVEVFQIRVTAVSVGVRQAAGLF
jgi:hypothetical protein